MPTIGPWFRRANRRSAKWHAGKYVEGLPADAHGHFFRRYTALCGFQTAAVVQVQIAPVGPAPDDEHGVCLHCSRAIEMRNRAKEKTD